VSAPSTIPRHVAIIMDGNGRWAKERGLPRREGHRAGAESVRECVEACKQLGIEYLTLYAFSSENWNRPPAEVSALMALLEKTRAKLDAAIARTADNQSLTLVLALSYGSREEITEAARSLVKDAAEGRLTPDEVDSDLFASRLYTAEIPDPDLMIRTSGEMRVSNFLLWQISYAELVIFRKFWPDFSQSDLYEAVEDYSRRHRRFGAL
jgi:undecaprenyl diphosphate synthase